MTTQELVDLANSLTREDMAQLIAMFAKDINIYVGTMHKEDGSAVQVDCELSAENPACLNGASIQLNAEWVESDDDAPWQS